MIRGILLKHWKDVYFWFLLEVLIVLETKPLHMRSNNM
jgi:hypothetical protein